MIEKLDKKLAYVNFLITKTYNSMQAFWKILKKYCHFKYIFCALCDSYVI